MTLTNIHSNDFEYEANSIVAVKTESNGNSILIAKVTEFIRRQSDAIISNADCKFKVHWYEPCDRKSDQFSLK